MVSTSSRVRVMAMGLVSKRFVGTLPYLLPIMLLWTLVGVFIYSQYQNEKSHRAMELDAQLQVVNRVLLNELSEGKPMEQALRGFALPLGNIRITLLSKRGQVLFDNMADATRMENHAYRGEVAQALRYGHGHTISRLSATNRIQYFYSATRGDDYVLRSALPYTVSLRETLQANSDIWWLVVALTAIITIVLLLLLRAVRQRNLHHQRLMEQEQEQIRIKRQLTNNINHELKTPVASIQVCLETLINSPNLSEAQHTKIIDRCYQSCQRLRNLLRDVSLITRVEEGNQHIAKTSIALNDLIDDLKAELDLYPPDKRLELHVDFAEQVQIMGNASLLISIFRNLTENAMAYSEGRTIRISLLENNAEHCTIAFEDDGQGVDEQHLPHLFERFYRVDKGRSRQTGGTGLGLAIVKHAVRFHGGSITATNKPEGGLRFVFTLHKAGEH